MLRTGSIFVVIALLGCASLASAGYMSQTDYSWIGNPGVTGTPICIKSSSGKYLLLDTSSTFIVPSSSCSTNAQWGAQLFFGKKDTFWLKSIPQLTFMEATNNDGSQVKASRTNSGWSGLWKFYSANDDGSFVMEIFQASSNPPERYYVALGSSDATITTDIDSATVFTTQLA